MTLTLDPDIRDWVVLPLFVIMVTTGLLRYTVGILFTNEKVKIPYITQRGQYMLKQTTRLTRTSAMHYMTTQKYTIRKQHIISLLRAEAQWCEDEKVRMEERSKNIKSDGTDGDTGDSSSGNNSSGGSTAASDPLTDMMNNPMKMMGGNMFFMVQNMVRFILFRFSDPMDFKTSPETQIDSQSCNVNLTIYFCFFSYKGDDARYTTFF
jgi:ER membrane protein complex subunit 3